MTPADQVSTALRALMVTTELVGDLSLAPRFARKQQSAMDAIIVAGAALEGLRRDLSHVARLAAKRRRAK